MEPQLEWASGKPGYSRVKRLRSPGPCAAAGAPGLSTARRAAMRDSVRGFMVPHYTFVRLCLLFNSCLSQRVATRMRAPMKACAVALALLAAPAAEAEA